MSQENVELVKQVLDFHGTLEHLSERTADRPTTARKQAAIDP
jgi:hypothetical protein